MSKVLVQHKKGIDDKKRLEFYDIKTQITNLGKAIDTMFYRCKLVPQTTKKIIMKDRKKTKTCMYFSVIT